MVRMVDGDGDDYYGGGDGDDDKHWIMDTDRDRGDRRVLRVRGVFVTRCVVLSFQT